MANNVLGKPEFALSHPTTATRLADRDTVESVVEAFTKSPTMSEVVAMCTERDVPCGAINSIEDIFADEQFAARGVLTEVMHETLGKIVIPNVLPRLSKTPGAIRTLGPKLGDWDGERLEALLNDDSQVRDLDLPSGERK